MKECSEPWLQGLAWRADTPLTSLSLFPPLGLSPPQSHHPGCSVCLECSSPAFS